jgi:hypothetical protein
MLKYSLSVVKLLVSKRIIRFFDRFLAHSNGDISHNLNQLKGTIDAY